MSKRRLLTLRAYERVIDDLTGQCEDPATKREAPDWVESARKAVSLLRYEIDDIRGGFKVGELPEDTADEVQEAYGGKVTP